MLVDFRDFVNNKIEEKVLSDGSIKNKKNIYSSETVKKWFINHTLETFKNFKDFSNTFQTEFNVTFYRTDLPLLVKYGYIKMNGREIKITLGEDNSKTETKKTNVKNLSKGKLKKIKIPQAKSNDKLQKFTETVILHMLGQEAGKLLLTGDPGTGKSRTVETLVSLLKMQCITIEAPHVSEEAIINIPYLVRRGNEVENNMDTYKSAGENDFEVINAESNLVTRLKRTKPIKDSEYSRFLKSNKVLTPLAENYKEVIETLPYQNVLFIDEYYRTGSKRIQNLFRTILNGNIGDTPIPANTYIIFASNMDNSDGSLDSISLNQQFSKINFDAPSKNDFMRYMADKFTNIDVNTGEVEEGKEEKENLIQPEVYNAFMDALDDADLGSKDLNTEAEIRISPRRWEEIIKYVNANIPVGSEKEARNVLTFLKNNMTDYSTQETSALFDKYEKVVKDLIKESSGIDASNIPLNTKKEWRDTLDNEIETKLKLGDDRKYVPIISGAPGIGKTSVVEKIAKDRNLNLITIDASTLNADDVIGLTVPTGNGDKIQTSFSTPPLFKKIMDAYKPNKDLLKSSKYTNILFIDEISRTSKKVFNGIRSLILDKKIGSDELPKDIMIMCAMNPDDTGVTELSDHFKDVVDVITSEANFNDFIDYMSNKKSLLVLNDKIGFDLTSIVVDMHKKITSLFESDTDTEDNELDDFNTRKYYWAPDNINIFYVSPREMDDMISGSITNSVNTLTLFKKFDKDNQYTEEELSEFANIISDKISDKYKSVLDFVAVDKGGIDEVSFEKLTAGVVNIVKETEIKIIDALNTIKSQATTTMKDIFEGSNYDIDLLLNEPTIKPTLENIIESEDVDEVKLDIMSAVDNMIKTNDENGLIENLVKMWMLLEKIDWSNFNSDITSALSVIFVKRGFNYALNKIVNTEDGKSRENKINKLKELYEKYPEETDKLADRARKNIYNLFNK